MKEGRNEEMKEGKKAMKEGIEEGRIETLMYTVSFQLKMTCFVSSLKFVFITILR